MLPVKVIRLTGIFFLKVSGNYFIVLLSSLVCLFRFRRITVKMGTVMFPRHYSNDYMGWDLH